MAMMLCREYDSYIIEICQLANCLSGFLLHRKVFKLNNI